MSAPLPRALQPFVSFAALLRANGFSVAPEQITTLLAAIALLGPSSLTDIRRAAHATLAPPPERRDEFNALFDAHFLGETASIAEEGAAAEDETRVQEGERGGFDPPLADDINEAGQVAATAEILTLRRFNPDDEVETLRWFARVLPERLPLRRGYRRRAAKRGAVADLRRTLREAVRTDGEVMRLPRLKRRPRQRNVLLLIDVSGSMKARTEAHFRFAHALARAVSRIEVFTIGTRLTRVTKALKIKSRDQALAAASMTVADWDGGTRIGEALQAFLSLPRFAGYARGAVTLVLSDGLERGNHRAMTDAVARLSALSWRLSWLTPLASDPQFIPQTDALRSILPYLDDLADGGSTERICDHVLRLAKARAA